MARGHKFAKLKATMQSPKFSNSPNFSPFKISRYTVIQTKLLLNYKGPTSVPYVFKNELTVLQPRLGSAPFSSNNSTISMLSSLVATKRAEGPPSGNYTYIQMYIKNYKIQYKPQKH